MAADLFLAVIVIQIRTILSEDEARIARVESTIRGHTFNLFQ